MVDVIDLIGLLSLPFFLALDLVWRGRRFDAPRLWRLRAFLVTAATYALSIGVAVLWGTLLPFSLFDLSGLGTWLGALAGVLVYELLHYGYHRLAHESDLLWRAAHQMHHSAESVDAFGAFYLHPLDTLFFGTLGSLVFFPLLGLSLEAGVVGAAFLAFNAAFQHANIRTPRWLGYLVQRPESHQLHHGRGVHRYNYSDLPLWDMVFGTFRNPATFEGETGFYEGASARIGEMLIGLDVSRPPAADRDEEPPRALPARDRTPVGVR